MKQYLVRFTDQEDAELQERLLAGGDAEAKNLSVAALLRAGVGMPPLQRGGHRKGAGKPIGSTDAWRREVGRLPPLPVK